MERKWEILTDWKINLETGENEFAYFNTKSFIPGQIYRIHRSTGLPVIVEFQKFGYRYNHDLSTTYPRILICDETADVPIDEITAICVYNINNDDENVPSESTESMKTTDVSGFKDFIVTKHSYHVNEKLKGVETIPGLFTDKMEIKGELKIVGIDRSSSSHTQHTQYVCIELPTGDAISIPASDNPMFGSNDYTNSAFNFNYPVFIEDKQELKWHEDLASGGFYIMLNKFGEKKLILIKSIHNDKIEHVVCCSRYDRNKLAYFVEAVSYTLTIEDAKDCKFISVHDAQ